MKKTTRYSVFFALITIAFFLCSCTAVQTVQKKEPVAQMYIDATVQNISESEMVLEIQLPEFEKASDPSIGEIAHQVIKKSLFLDGITTEIEGKPLVVKEVRGNNITVFLDKPATYSVGTRVKLKIPKKTIAVVDFEVIRGKQKEVGKVTLEGLTSALINSGQFNVVERAKLKTILDELALNMTGLMNESSKKNVGQLQMADLILTGTLAEMKGKWDVNLRLLNVRTGQALAAISMRMPLFRPSEMRDSGPMNESFEEDTIDPSWQTGYKKRGIYYVGLDKQEGTGESKHSLFVRFNFKKEKAHKVFAKAENRMKRDLYFYRGVEFYVKSTELLTGKLWLATSDPDDPNVMDAWTGSFEMDTEWKKIKIPFESLTVGRGWIKGGAKKYGAKYGDQVLRPNRVEIIGMGLLGKNNPSVKGKMWIDEIRFYQ